MTGPGANLSQTSSLTPCLASKAIVFRLPRFHGKPITRVQVYVGKRLVMTRRGKSLRSIRLAGLPGSGQHKIRVVEYTRSGRARVADDVRLRLVDGQDGLAVHAAVEQRLDRLRRHRSRST